MSVGFPFGRSPWNRRYAVPNIKHVPYKKQFNEDKKAPKNKVDTNNKVDTKNHDGLNNDCFINIFGIKLHYDDVLLISLIFFLYDEGVDDTGLFIALIMLLLS